VENVPASYEEWPNAVMTNFDHTIDNEVAGILMEKPFYAQYSGWNFCGYVWWDDGMWACEVMQYNATMEVVRAETLDEVMEIVSDRYGYY